MKFVGLVVALSVAVALGMAGWRVCGPYGERCSETGQFFPEYDADTGQIDLVMHDLNGNGVVDTWVHRGAAGIEAIEIDRDEDGTIDRRLVPDPHGVFRPAETEQ